MTPVCWVYGTPFNNIIGTKILKTRNLTMNCFGCFETLLLLLLLFICSHGKTVYNELISALLGNFVNFKLGLNNGLNFWINKMICKTV